MAKASRNEQPEEKQLEEKQLEEEQIMAKGRLEWPIGKIRCW